MAYQDQKETGTHAMLVIGRWSWVSLHPAVEHLGFSFLISGLQYISILFVAFVNISIVYPPAFFE